MEGLKMGIWCAHGEGKLISDDLNNICLLYTSPSPRD